MATPHPLELQELAAVLEDAASHEAAAVEVAVTNERMSCIYRMASFLQVESAGDFLTGSTDFFSHCL